MATFLKPEVSYTFAEETRSAARRVSLLKDAQIYSLKRSGMDDLATQLGIDPLNYRTQQSLLDAIRLRAAEVSTRTIDEEREVINSDEYRLANLIANLRESLESAKRQYTKAIEGMQEPGMAYWGNLGQLIEAQGRISAYTRIVAAADREDREDPLTLAEVRDWAQRELLRRIAPSSTSRVSNALETAEAQAYAAIVEGNPFAL
jgi:hypothetical protein